MSWNGDDWGDTPPGEERQDQAGGISEEWDDFEPFEVCCICMWISTYST